MNGQELIGILESKSNGEEKFWELVDQLEESDQELGLGPIETVEEVGGGEGGGEEVVRVFHFKDHDVFIEITGSYYSYDGINWEEGVFTQVYPKQVMVTQYVKEPA